MRDQFFYVYSSRCCENDMYLKGRVQALDPCPLRSYLVTLPLLLPRF